MEYQTLSDAGASSAGVLCVEAAGVSMALDAVEAVDAVDVADVADVVVVVVAAVAVVCVVVWAGFEHDTRQNISASSAISSFFIYYSSLRIVYDFMPVRVMDFTSCFSNITNRIRTGRMAITEADIIT